MAISDVPLNLDRRGYAGSLLLPRTIPGRESSGAGSNIRDLLEQAFQMRQAISRAQIRAMNEDIRRGREEVLERRNRERSEREFRDKTFRFETDRDRFRDKTDYGSAALALLSQNRAYRQPGDVENLASWLRFIGPERAHAGLMQSGALLGSTRGGINVESPEEFSPAYELSGSPAAVESDPFQSRDLSSAYERLAANPSLRSLVPAGRYNPSFGPAMPRPYARGTLPGTVPETGPAKVHRGEVILSKDQVDGPLLKYLVFDKMRKLRSGQMDGKGTGRGYQRGTLYSSPIEWERSLRSGPMARMFDPEISRIPDALRPMTSYGSRGNYFVGSSASPAGNPFAGTFGGNAAPSGPAATSTDLRLPERRVPPVSIASPSIPRFGLSKGYRRGSLPSYQVGTTTTIDTEDPDYSGSRGIPGSRNIPLTNPSDPTTSAPPPPVADPSAPTPTPPGTNATTLTPPSKPWWWLRMRGAVEGTNPFAKNPRFDMIGTRGIKAPKVLGGSIKTGRGPVTGAQLSGLPLGEITRQMIGSPVPAAATPQGAPIDPSVATPGLLNLLTGSPENSAAMPQGFQRGSLPGASIKAAALPKDLVLPKGMTRSYAEALYPYLFALESSGGDRRKIQEPLGETLHELRPFEVVRLRWALEDHARKARGRAERSLPHYRRGSLPEFQEGSPLEEMFNALDPAEQDEILGFMREGERELRTRMATGGTSRRGGGRRSRDSELLRTLTNEDLKLSPTLTPEFSEESLEFNEFDPVTSRSSIPPEREIALRPSERFRRVGGGTTGPSPKVRIVEPEKAWLVKASRMAKSNPGGFRRWATKAAERARSPRAKLLLGALAAGGATAAILSGRGGESRTADIIGRSPEEDRRGFAKDLEGALPPALPAGGGEEGFYPGRAFLEAGQTFMEDPSARSAGESIRHLLGEAIGPPLEGIGNFAGGLFGTEEEPLLSETPPIGSEGAPAPLRDYLDEILSETKEEAERARREEGEASGGLPAKHRESVERARLREGADKLWDHLEKNVNRMSEAEYKVFFSKATRLDQLADRMEKRLESREQRAKDIRGAAEEALQRTREARMQRGVESERYEKEIRQKEAINLREQVETLERALAREEPGSEKWNSFIGLLTQAHEEMWALGGREVEPGTARKLVEDHYLEAFGG